MRVLGGEDGLKGGLPGEKNCPDLESRDKTWRGRVWSFILEMSSMLVRWEGSGKKPGIESFVIE